MKSSTTSQPLTATEESFSFKVLLARSIMVIIMQFTMEANFSAASAEVMPDSSLRAMSLSRASSTLNAVGVPKVDSSDLNLPGAPKVRYEANCAEKGWGINLFMSVSREVLDAVERFRIDMKDFFFIFGCGGGGIAVVVGVGGGEEVEVVVVELVELVVELVLSAAAAAVLVSSSFPLAVVSTTSTLIAPSGLGSSSPTSTIPIHSSLTLPIPTVPAPPLPPVPIISSNCSLLLSSSWFFLTL
mmetsp:Transcript_23/g.34  ORF Transcript_23/g.34 Transcript_23/m.34 type:complete len:243 (+) Transcript_23:257-985(+)